MRSLFISLDASKGDVVFATVATLPVTRPQQGLASQSRAFGGVGGRGSSRTTSFSKLSHGRFWQHFKAQIYRLIQVLHSVIL